MNKRAKRKSKIFKTAGFEQTALYVVFCFNFICNHLD